jgi:hypothetical protein
MTNEDSAPDPKEVWLLGIPLPTADGEIAVNEIYSSYLSAVGRCEELRAKEPGIKFRLEYLMTNRRYY